MTQSMPPPFAAMVEEIDASDVDETTPRRRRARREPLRRGTTRNLVIPDDPTVLSYLLSGIVQIELPSRQALLEAATTTNASKPSSACSTASCCCWRAVCASSHPTRDSCAARVAASVSGPARHRITLIILPVAFNVVFFDLGRTLTIPTSSAASRRRS